MSEVAQEITQSLGATAAKFFAEHGIDQVEKREPDHSVVSIGFSAKEQRWYGWSHRAIYGFGIGSKIAKGDCGYIAKDPQDFLEECRDFWDNDHHARTWAEHADENGVPGVRVSWVYADTVPNEALRGTTGGTFQPYPAWGRGAWTAATLDDAKQMAKDFAEGVS